MKINIDTPRGWEQYEVTKKTVEYPYASRDLDRETGWPKEIAAAVERDKAS